MCVCLCPHKLHEGVCLSSHAASLVRFPVRKVTDILVVAAAAAEEGRIEEVEVVVVAVEAMQARVGQCYEDRITARTQVESYTLTLTYFVSPYLHRSC